MNNISQSAYHQKYFRPSCSPALNLRFASFDFFQPYFDKKPNEIILPAELANTPENTLLNYFSILREAENIGVRSCGSIGEAKIPFPIAYNFLSESYQQRINYEEYLNSFSGRGHTTLIKLCRVPDMKKKIRFFYELETIEAIENKSAEYFGYYYGFIQLASQNNGYRILDINQTAEDFLCAPYHGWDHDAESIVDVKYGSWCKLIEKRYPAVKKDYVKTISFHGKDDADYSFIFFTLTNGTDLEIAQFRKSGVKNWEQVNMKPEEECL
ncbi:hypothetical protein ACFVHQ_02155 [Actinomycetes bacterium NPDC127524]